MGLKTFAMSAEALINDFYLRNDEKYHRFLSSSDWNVFNSKQNHLVPLKNILIDDYSMFDYQVGEEYKGIPTGQTYLDEDGEIKDYVVVTLEDHPGRLKYKITNQNILISSLRLAKSPALFFENTDLSQYVFSNGFYIFKVIDSWNNKFVLYILRNKRVKKIIDDHIYRGIGISSYKKEDLLKIKIPFISKDKQDKIVLKIEPIEKRINEIKSYIIPPQQIINLVFSREFGFDIEEVNNVERTKYFSITNDITFKNTNLRSSVRWNKIFPIQKVLYKNVDCVERLGKHIMSTQNGWSPNCKETDEDYAVFGVNSISKDGYIKYMDLKFSNEEKSNISDYYAKDDDLFISRGNTIDLVALASVVKNLPEERNFVFPDLFIRLEVNNDTINKEYLAFLFNSIIGRFYFKYAAKGKNQTMVKVSADELNNFYLPIPSMEIQTGIVKEIKSGLGEQKEKYKNIEKERAKIDDLIIKSLS